MQAVLPRPDILPLLDDGYVLLAADVDDMEDQVAKLVNALPNAMMLPFAIVANSDGSYVAGKAGAASPDAVKALLASASA